MPEKVWSQRVSREKPAGGQYTPEIPIFTTISHFLPQMRPEVVMFSHQKQNRLARGEQAVLLAKIRFLESSTWFRDSKRVIRSKTEGGGIWGSWSIGGYAKERRDTIFFIMSRF
jgi:hypothetical protein